MEPRASARPERPPHRALILVPIFFYAHVAEEWLGGFPAWATEHFGTTSPTWFAVSHVPLVAWTALVGVLGARVPTAPFWPFAAVATQASILGNGVFHLVTTIAFAAYSPGLVTALLFHLPFGIWLLLRCAKTIGRGWAAVALLLGLGSQVLVVASLFLDPPL